MTNVLTPDVIFPAEERAVVTTVHGTEGIGAFTGLSTGRKLRVSWPAWMLTKWSQNIYEDNGCLEAWLPFPPGAVAGVLGTVRNRIVEFTLSIGADAPDIDGVSVGDRPVPPETVEARYQTIIPGHGHAISLVACPVSVRHIGQQVVAGDLDSLRAFLEREGVRSRTSGG